MGSAAEGEQGEEESKPWHGDGVAMHRRVLILLTLEGALPRRLLGLWRGGQGRMLGSVLVAAASGDPQPHREAPSALAATHGSQRSGVWLSPVLRCRRSHPYSAGAHGQSGQQACGSALSSAPAHLLLIAAKVHRGRLGKQLLRFAQIK